MKSQNRNFSYDFTTISNNKLLDYLALLAYLDEDKLGVAKALKKEAVKRGIHIQQPNLFI